MAVVMIMHWPEIAVDQYEEARRRVDWEGDQPEGGLTHVSWFEDGLHVIEMWESPEDFERFGNERLMPIVKGEMGVESDPDVKFAPLHALFIPEAARV